MTDLFTEVTPANISDDTDFLSELVGENKKFKDVQSLAKGKATSDLYINQLEAELAEVRNELKTRATVEDIFTRMKTPESNTPYTPPEEPDGKIKPEDIDALVQQALAKTTQAQREAANYDLVTTELQKNYGSNFQQHLNARLAELGMDKNVATNLARTQPKAFLKLFADGVPNAGPASAPRGAVNTAGFVPQGNTRGASYYDKLRKEMGAAKFFADVSLQRQRWQDIQALGQDKFSSS